MKKIGSVDALQTWELTDEAAKKEVLAYAHSKGAKILLSAAGSTEAIEDFFGSDPLANGIEYGTEMAKRAITLGLDGVDFDMELTPQNYAPFESGEFQKFTKGCALGVNTVDLNLIVSFAPQGPYFATWTRDPELGYTALMKDDSLKIDFVNIQFYNQGDKFYTTYDTQFIQGIDDPKNNMYTSQSAIDEMIKNGVPAEKILLGKPMTSTDGYSGFTSSSNMLDWTCRYWKESGNKIGGFMAWMYPGAEDPALKAFGKDISGRC